MTMIKWPDRANEMHVKTYTILFYLFQHFYGTEVKGHTTYGASFDAYRHIFA
jgi:hypothetical protein